VGQFDAESRYRAAHAVEGVEKGTEKADYDYEHEHEHEKLSRQVKRVHSIRRPLLFVLVPVLVIVIGFFDPFSTASQREW